MKRSMMTMPFDDLDYGPPAGGFDADVDEEEG